jgi:hypothetical protein
LNKKGLVMSYFLLDTIAVPLASLAALLGFSARSAPPASAPIPAPVAAHRPVEEPAPTAAPPAASSVFPDYGADSSCGWMTGAIAAFRTF